jgi:hypothetical protein
VDAKLQNYLRILNYFAKFRKTVGKYRKISLNKKKFNEMNGLDPGRV